jgi:pimeloyl-ACP methyl ester carboxylesterase
MLWGYLLRYSSTSSHVAFYSPTAALQSGTASYAVSPNVVIVIGGLTDGLWALKYVPPLIDGATVAGWDVVQFTMSSSYEGFGTGSLQRDSDELDLLLDSLASQLKSRCGEEKRLRCVLVGHSTGYQDAVWFLRHGRNRANIAGVVLQGSLSDREFAYHHDPRTSEWVKLSSEMIKEKRQDELMPREAFFVPITAYRFHSLTSRFVCIYLRALI